MSALVPLELDSGSDEAPFAGLVAVVVVLDDLGSEISGLAVFTIVSFWGSLYVDLVEEVAVEPVDHVAFCGRVGSL